MTLHPSSSRVLVVEDHEDTRAALVLTLSRAGFEPIETGNGRDAFEQLIVDEHLPLLMVLDLELPIMTGWELLALMRNYSRFATLPVLVVSARESPAATLRPDSHTAYLRKPFDPDELIAFANAVVRGDPSGRWRV